MPMHLRSVAVTLALLSVTGCGKLKSLAEQEEPATSASAVAPVAPAPATTAQAHAAMSALKGSHTLIKDAKVYLAADPSSQVLGFVPAGAKVELKGKLNQWLFVEWTSAPGVTSPGWLEVPAFAKPVDSAAAASASASSSASAAASAVAIPVPSASAAASASTGKPRPTFDVSKLLKKKAEKK